MDISKVVPSDIPEIAALQNRLLLGGRGVKTGGGFLVSGYSEDDYRRFAEMYEYFFKATVNGKIAGVLMAFESGNIPPEDKNNSLLKYAVKKDFVLIKQIFVSPDAANTGVATRLYKHLFSLIPPARPAVTVVVTEPFNRISCEFHKRRGFSEFLAFVPEPDRDGKTRRRSAWIRPSRDDDNFHDDIRLSNMHDGVDDIGQTMSTRVSNLVDLYMHEDNLNWTKIGQQCTILFALIAGFAWFYGKALPEVSYPLLAIAGTGGVVINVMFFLKIRSGLRYMNTYKQKIRECDRQLTFHYPKVGAIFDEGAFISRRSVTSRLLLALSGTGIAIWILATLLMVLNAISPSTVPAGA
jgi:predicted GNAT superfamily acetyltransferase